MTVSLDTIIVNEKIDSWYKAIKELNITKARELATELDQLYKQSSADSFAYNYYQLILFRYQLMFKDVESATQVLKDIEPFHESSEILQYYYHSFKGIYYYILNRYQDSIDSFKKAQPHIIFSEHQDEIGEFHYKMAASYYEHYQNALSIKHLHNALKVFQKNYLYKRSADCELLLALNLTDLRDYEDAELHYHNALRYCDHFNDLEYKHAVIFNLGTFYHSQNYKDEAVQYFNRSREYFLEQNQSDYAIKATYQLAKLYYLNRDFGTATEYQNEGQVLSEEQDNQIFLQRFKTLYVYSDKKIEEHESEIQEGLSYFEENEMWNDVIHIGELLTRYYHDQHQFEKSSKTSQRVILAKRHL
ncbi:hypothetical protein ACSVDE_14815 [Pseudalkalibacillus sp. Hm43]|uniref:response regulator aspartate phosphatase n=1 Tax=Pseudalkalibacillus sp. Hm43 TaxID=3450742 RepID=UPI003F426559